MPGELENCRLKEGVVAAASVNRVRKGSFAYPPVPRVPRSIDMQARNGKVTRRTKGKQSDSGAA